MTNNEPKNDKPERAAAVEAIAFRIEELIIDGQVPPTVDDAVLQECARRYVAIERAKRDRTSVRDVTAFQKTEAERSEKLRARIRSIVDELAADHPVEWTPELLASTFTVPGPSQTHPKGATHE